MDVEVSQAIVRAKYPHARAERVFGAGWCVDSYEPASGIVGRGDGPGDAWMDAARRLSPPGADGVRPHVTP